MKIKIQAKNVITSRKGITLISLVVTIAVLVILTSIAIYSGVDVIRKSKLNRFTTEMKIMQTEVNELYNRYSNGETEVLNLGKELDSQASNVFTESSSGITDSSGYRYYDKETIESLGIEYVEEEVYVNVAKRSVVSKLGIEYEGEKYYTLEQLPNGLYNVEYEKIKLDNEGYFSETITVNGGEPSENNPIIPEGFKPVDTDTSKWPSLGTTEPAKEDVNNGLVIEDKNGSQFVWIPVGDINDMAQCYISGGNCNLKLEEDGTLKCEAHNSTEIVGKLYATSTGANFGTVNKTYYANSRLREPAVVTGNSLGTGTSYDGNVSYYKNMLGYNSLSEMLDDFKDKYKDMATSIAKYKGFYIGRYELGLEGDTPVSKNASINTSVITTDASNSKTNTWYGLYKKCLEYKVPEASNSSVVSTMIWGSQYDAMMNWMKDNGKNITSANASVQNNSYVTGQEAKDVISNVFDLYACHVEWTLEGDYYDSRVYRGSYSNQSNSPSYRASSLSNNISNVHSSRITLYIRLDNN